MALYKLSDCAVSKTDLDFASYVGILKFLPFLEHVFQQHILNPVLIILSLDKVSEAGLLQDMYVAEGDSVAGSRRVFNPIAKILYIRLSEFFNFVYL